MLAYETNYSDLSPSSQWIRRSIVETDTDKGHIQKIIKATGGSSPAPVSSLLDVVTALKHAREDPRIVGILANFSTGNSSTKSKGLGIAQIQELRTAIQEFKEAKAKALGGEDKVSLIAYTDSFGEKRIAPPSVFKSRLQRTNKLNSSLTLVATKKKKKKKMTRTSTILRRPSTRYTCSLVEAFPLLVCPRRSLSSRPC
jgi:hypothetical protein